MGWSGRDDTSETIILFPSQATGYEPTDVIKTAEAALEQQFRKPAADIGVLGGEYGVDTVDMEQSVTGPPMIITVEKRFDASSGTTKLRITAHDFKP